MREERGATITIVAVSLVALLSMLALAIDIGMLYKARNDAQRVADAAALAGASAYIDASATLVDSASARAFEYIAQNHFMGTTINTSPQTTTTAGGNTVITTPEAVVTILPATFRVRALIRRASVGTWFARFFGKDAVPIGAGATAEAIQTGGATCVKPFAIADLWSDPVQDLNRNRLQDNGEDWTFDPTADHYAPWQHSADYTAPETGYGSDFRDPTQGPGIGTTGIFGDAGRPLVLKPQDPQVDAIIRPGNFFAWDMPDDPSNTSKCGLPGAGGASAYSRWICSCNNSVITTGTPYPIENGNMVGPTKFGIQDLIKLDPTARWDDVNKTVVSNNPAYQGQANPRVIKVAVYDPIQVQKSGKINISFTNIALMFVEAYQRVPGNKDDAVIARFMTYAPGVGTPGPGGPLARYVRLVQ
jgi:Flp pilus assembly protein TadG